LFQAPPRGKEALSWALVVVWTLVIYATVPFARAMQRWVAGHIGAGSVRWICIGLIVAIMLLSLWRIFHRMRRLPWPQAASLVGVASIFIYLALERMKTPSEAVHFIEYGALGLWAFRALAHRQRDPLIYLNAVLICALASTVDEMIQWITPGRYWDIRDLWHNVIAAGLIQVAVAAGFRPAFIARPIRPRSVRWAAALAAIQLLLIGLASSNTPVAAARISERLPAFSFLLDNDHAMSEYGFRHEDPDLGRFYSRFTREDLQWIDHKRGPEVGAILDHYTRVDAYTNFLRRFTPGRDAFTHEAMVHLFRRNHYLDVLPNHISKPDSYRFHATVAYRENQILERYYSNSLLHAAQWWTDPLKEALQPHINPGRYRSEVSRHLIHRISERHIWSLIGLALLAVAAIGWRWGRERG
jgi:VanZ family protein